MGRLDLQSSGVAKWLLALVLLSVLESGFVWLPALSTEVRLLGLIGIEPHVCRSKGMPPKVGRGMTVDSSVQGWQGLSPVLGLNQDGVQSLPSLLPLKGAEASFHLYLVSNGGATAGGMLLPSRQWP